MTNNQISRAEIKSARTVAAPSLVVVAAPAPIEPDDERYFPIAAGYCGPQF